MKHTLKYALCTMCAKKDIFYSLTLRHKRIPLHNGIERIRVWGAFCLY